MTPPWRTVVLSPHFDDAALSVAALVRRLPRPLTVVTVFGGPPPEDSPVSWWDATCGFSSAAEAYACRRAEDARACALLEAEQILLPNPDGPYGATGPLRGLDALLAGLTADTTVLVPLGTNQPDHERVRHQALAALDRPDAARTLVYADLPYTGHLPEWATDGASDALAASQKWGLAYQELTRHHPCSVAHDVRLDDEQWAAKRAAVLSHASQLAPLAADHGSLAARSGPLRAELAWTLDARPSPGA
ncbi:PIG-L deacetylase family protein [Streptomyces sp. CBG9]|uniref:PIG-L deacetylase family protein n=1 Tax=Streptomyces sp. CBG9 TaxID=2762622 RepID=UPI0016456FD8|nr:PIG-L family deacetylase [Streptomyces sp. CBG9]